jgi:hypothetical protein
MRERLRPERRAKSRRESERGWGPASIEKSRPSLTTWHFIALCVGLLQVVSATPDEAPAMWPAELKKGWSVEVGEGYSSPVSGNGR